MSHFIKDDSFRISDGSKLPRKRRLRHLLGAVDYLCWPSKALFAAQQLVQLRPSWASTQLEASWTSKAAAFCPSLLSKNIRCPGTGTSSCPNSSSMDEQTGTALVLYQVSLFSCLQPCGCLHTAPAGPQSKVEKLIGCSTAGIHPSQPHQQLCPPAVTHQLCLSERVEAIHSGEEKATRRAYCGPPVSEVGYKKDG